jgi:hypothetical protein
MARRRTGLSGPHGGRPPLPVEVARRNRVVVMVTDGELTALRRLARERGVAPGTLAHEVLARVLRRREGGR